MIGGVSPETCWAIKKHWSNKFYYTVPACWFYLWDLYYDARIHDHQIEAFIWKDREKSRINQVKVSLGQPSNKSLTNYFLHKNVKNKFPEGVWTPTHTHLASTSLTKENKRSDCQKHLTAVCQAQYVIIPKFDFCKRELFCPPKHS